MFCKYIYKDVIVKLDDDEELTVLSILEINSSKPNICKTFMQVIPYVVCWKK